MEGFVKDVIKLIDSHYTYLGEEKGEIFEDFLAIMVANQVPITTDLLGIADSFDSTLEESKYYVERYVKEHEEELYEEGSGC